jgi:hypothetical protein
MLRRIVYVPFVLGFGLLAAFPVETQTQITAWHALALTRTINTIEVVHFYKTGVYADRAALLDYLREQKNDTKAGGRVREWTSRLNFFSDEILPGWFMDYEMKPGNTGYILILTGSDEEQKSVVITDEKAVIYRATPYATDRLPTAREITRAQDFPGAKSI